MNKIALAMIVKGTGEEAANLDRALTSARKHVDDVFITITGPKDEVKETEEVCKKHGAIVSHKQFLYEVQQEEVDWVTEFFGYPAKFKAGDKLFLFDEARNYNFSQVGQEYDWILWMDCDDMLKDGEHLRRLAEEGLKNGIEAYYFDYLYHVEIDDKGYISNVLIKHLRERLVRNIGVYKWIAPIHETLIEQRPTKKTDNYDVAIVHLSTLQNKIDSLNRNLGNLEYSIYLTKGKDPRPIYYLAKAYYDLSTEDYDKKAVRLIDIYLNSENRSGWPEERAQAYEYMSDIFRRRGQLDDAIMACLSSLKEHPETKTTYLNMATTYIHKQEYERALFWVRLADTIPEKQTTLVKNPKDFQGKMLEVIYNACLNLGKLDEAWAAATKILDLYPGDENATRAYQLVNQIRMERDITKSITQIADFLKKTGERPKIRALINAIPRGIEDNPFMVNLKQTNLPSKYWGNKDIAIYCGQGFTPWGPNYMRKPQGTFMGGSEEAVVLMSEALARKGWSVTVYNDCGEDEGEHNGVTYLPYYKFNRTDKFNILIAWRDIRFFDTEFKAKKTYLWNHDIQNPLEYTPERLSRITKVFFLSEWHRDNVTDLPDDKILLTTNGI